MIAHISWQKTTFHDKLSAASREGEPMMLAACTRACNAEPASPAQTLPTPAAGGKPGASRIANVS